MLQLNNRVQISKKRKRVGRGGDLGGTSGKGHKGQKARSGGYVRRSFEGGQMPLARRLPKRGFNNDHFQPLIKIVNLDLLENLFDQNATVDKTALIEKKVVKGKKPFLLKILGHGTLTKSLIIHTDMVSASAKEGVERAGGQIHLLKD